jgi:hypothetical protein
VPFLVIRDVFVGGMTDCVVTAQRTRFSRGEYVVCADPWLNDDNNARTMLKLPTSIHSTCSAPNLSNTVQLVEGQMSATSYTAGAHRIKEFLKHQRMNFHLV